MRVSWRLAWICVALALPASAHLRFPAMKAERFVELRLGEEPIRVGYRVGLGVTRAAAERTLADTDHDGSVSASEGNTALDRHTDELLAALEVCTGPNLEKLSCKKLDRRSVERVAAEGWLPDESGHLHFIWTLRLSEAARQIGAIRVADSYDSFGGVVEMTDVEIQAPSHTPLTLAGEGGRSAGLATHFVWLEARRAPGPRVIVAAWAPPSTSWRKLAVFAAVAVALGALALGWSRRSSLR